MERVEIDDVELGGKHSFGGGGVGMHTLLSQHAVNAKMRAESPNAVTLNVGNSLNHTERGFFFCECRKHPTTHDTLLCECP